MMNRQDRVADDEELYRRVREKVAGQTCYRAEGGKVVFFQSAFNDVSKQPSVDRAILKESDPHRSRLTLEDGIIVLQANAIRRLGPILQLDSRGRRIHEYAVDVLPDPKFGNCAHALVVTRPPISGTGAFKRLKDGLVRLANEAGWRIEPRTPLPRRKVLTIVLDTFQCVLRRLRRIK